MAVVSPIARHCAAGTQGWPSRTSACTPAGTCRWSGCEFTCRPLSSSPRTLRRRSASRSWRRSMCRSTSLPWWEPTRSHSSPPYEPSVFSSQTRNASIFSHLMFVSPGFPLLLGVLGADPGQILLHHLWLPWVSVYMRTCDTYDVKGAIGLAAHENSIHLHNSNCELWKSETRIHTHTHIWTRVALSRLLPTLLFSLSLSCFLSHLCWKAALESV